MAAQWQKGIVREMECAAVIETRPRTYGAHLPDLPRCIAVGDTLEQVQQLTRDAIGLHIQRLREDRLPVPKPPTRCEYLEA